MTTQQKIMALTRQLYPTGRAFKMPAGGWLEKLHHALGISEAKAYNDAVSLLNGLLPDNPNFTEEDASTWEVRLGMIDGTGTQFGAITITVAGSPYSSYTFANGDIPKLNTVTYS